MQNRLDLYLYLTSNDILRAFHKNKFHCEFNPDKEIVADIVPSNLFTRWQVMKWDFKKMPTWSGHIKRSNERLNRKKEVNYENVRRIGSKHGIGQYLVLSYGDDRPFDAR